MGQGSLAAVQAERPPGPPAWLEWALAALAPIGWAWAAFVFHTQGRLPKPFQSNPAEALMDLYNTAFWANRAGAYEVWHSVYPPLSFDFLRLFTRPSCYAANPYAARACDPSAAWVILGFFLLNVVLVFLSLRLSRPGRALPRTVALCGGASMLYGLELANLIIPTFTAFVLAEGALLRSGALRQLFRVIAINFKPYLLLLAIPPLLQRRWGWLIGLTAAGLAVYGLTAVMQGDGAPWVILRNFYLYTLTLPDKYGINNHLAEISAQTGGLWLTLFPIPLRAIELAIMATFVVAAIRPRMVEPSIHTALALSLLCSEAALHTQGYSADYTMVFLLFVVFQQTGSRRLGGLALALAYLLCAPIDLVFFVAARTTNEGFFAGGPVSTPIGPSLGQFLRPLFLMALQLCLIVSAIPAWPHRRSDLSHS